MNSNLYSTQFTLVGYAAFWVSAVVIGVFISVVFLSFIFQREIVKRQIRVLLLLFLVALSIWALLWDPPPYYDSYKHFQWLNQIRQQKHGLLAFLQEGFYGSEVGNYYGLIAFNILRYIVVSISSNNHVLPFLGAAIDYLIFYYVVTDFFKREKISTTWLFVTCSLSFSFMPYFMVVSGIRNALAASIAGLAIYNKLYKQHKQTEYFILSIIALTIHPNVLLPLLLAIVYPLFRGPKSFLLLVFSMVFFGFGYKLLKMSGIAFLVYVGEVIEFYIGDNQYYGEITTYISDIIVLICCILLLLRKKKRYACAIENDAGVEKERYSQFIFVYCWAVLAVSFVGGTNFLTRGCYVLGILSVFFVKQFSELSFRASRRGILNLALMMIIIFATFVNISHESFLLLAQFF